MRTALGERVRLAAALITLLGLLLLIVPTLLLGETLVEGTQSLAAGLRDEAVAIPAPPEDVRRWPLVGEEVYEYWANASENLGSTLETLRPQIVAFGGWLLATAAGAGFAFLQSVLSVLIAGVLLANDAGGSRVARFTASTMNGPIVMFGTKCPSITSTCTQSAPPRSMESSSSPRRVKSAARIDGAMRGVVNGSSGVGWP